MLRAKPFVPPQWASALVPPRSGRCKFAALPTPVMPWACPELAELGVRWSIKRDDFSGVELSGNKARKLEFLMAEALAANADCVVTIGGLQSNHCRATAAAARLVGLETHLVLLVSDRKVDEEVGLAGNLLASRLMGAKLHLVAGSDYLRAGGDLKAMDRLNAAKADELRSQGRRPYVVPVGGTGGAFALDGQPVGTWGYLNAVQELLEQLRPRPAADADADADADAADGVQEPDYIVVAAGSGGTAAGLALGCRLSPLSAQLHAVNVQHKPDPYYDLVDEEAALLGFPRELGAARELLTIHDGGGLGYGVASREELEMIARVGAASGVVLDHVYTGKALYHFVQHARAHPEAFRGKRVLFWHTGGLPGLQTKSDELVGMVPPAARFVPHLG